MNPHNTEMLLRLSLALVAGALIGYERSYHGRPAGFRTHALVCASSALLMLVTVYQDHWMHVAPELIRLDPTRMSQGIMTGIGFLGAGVIIKEGLSVRGLTTAASIWMTAAIGIIAGIGFYFPLALAVALTVGVLSIFRWLERHMPAQIFYQFEIQFRPDAVMAEDDLRALIQHNGFSVANFSYRFDRDTRTTRHGMLLRTRNRANAAQLRQALEAAAVVGSYELTPTGDK